MKENVLLKDSVTLTLKRGNDIISEQKVNGDEINLMEELWKIIQCFSNIKEK